MSPQEREQFDYEVCKRWKGKFSLDELERWFSAMQPWSIEDARAALNKFKDTSRFVPRIGEILKLLPRQVASEQRAKPERPLSQIVAGNMNVNEAADVREKLTRYWRNVWWAYKLAADVRRESMNIAAQIVAQRENVDVQTVTAKKTFVESVEMWERQLEGMRKKCWMGCRNSLVTEGVTVADANICADWIEVQPDEFQRFLDDVRYSNLTDPFGVPAAEKVGAA